VQTFYFLLGVGTGVAAIGDRQEVRIGVVCIDGARRHGTVVRADVDCIPIYGGAGRLHSDGLGEMKGAGIIAIGRFTRLNFQNTVAFADYMVCRGNIDSLIINSICNQILV
jgi:hypothetical protein